MLIADCATGLTCGVNTKKCLGAGESDSLTSPSPSPSSGSTPSSPASQAITGYLCHKAVACVALDPVNLPFISAQVVVQLSSLLNCQRSPWRLSRHSSRVTSGLLCSQKQRAPQRVLSATCMMAVWCWILLSLFQRQTAMQPVMLPASRMLCRQVPPLSSLLTPMEMSQLGLSLQVSSTPCCVAFDVAYLLLLQFALEATPNT